MQDLNLLRNEFENYLRLQIPDKEPENLYAPLRYVLQNGGKRIRPLLVLLAAHTFDSSIEKAMPAAAAVEMFHNFTLIHDDIMDKAPIRRGKPTVHIKWNENLAILSGDTLLVWAYKMLESYEASIYKPLSSLLNQTAIEVCEGQQMDMDFEQKDRVSLKLYVEMIRLKTAVLLGAALQFGGMVAQTTEENLKHIANFGINLGLAFQIQDDYLDTYGTTENFGKKIGGDIRDRKKTFLYISALESAGEKDKRKLIDLFKDKKINDETLWSETMTVYNKYKVNSKALKKIDYYTHLAIQELDLLQVKAEHKQFWKKFAFQLMQREK